LNKGRKDLAPEIKNFIKHLTHTISGEREKAKAIYQWMQTPKTSPPILVAINRRFCKKTAVLSTFVQKCNRMAVIRPRNM